MTDKLDLTIYEMNLSSRSKNALARNDYYTLRDIVSATTEELARGYNIGKKSFVEISNEVRRHGYALGMSVPPAKKPKPNAKWYPIDLMPFDTEVLAYCDGHYAVINRTRNHKFAAPWTHWTDLPEGPQ